MWDHAADSLACCKVLLWRFRLNILNDKFAFVWGEIPLLPLVWVKAGELPKASKGHGLDSGHLDCVAFYHWDQDCLEMLKSSKESHAIPLHHDLHADLRGCIGPVSFKICCPWLVT